MRANSDRSLKDLGDEPSGNHVLQTGDEKAAWFADSEGNILCLHEFVIDHINL